jgi:hypothetical protein
LGTRTGCSRVEHLLLALRLQSILTAGTGRITSAFVGMQMLAFPAQGQAPDPKGILSQQRVHSS